MVAWADSQRGEKRLEKASVSAKTRHSHQARAADLNRYARLCGWTLARAHARSGDPVAIAGYLGSSDTFDRAVTELAERYADQNERDYEAFLEEIRSGRLEAASESS